MIVAAAGGLAGHSRATAQSGPVICAVEANRLSIQVGPDYESFAEIVRDPQGSEIFVRTRGGDVVPCGGPTPTTFTIDRITFFGPARSDSLAVINLAGGRFGPGATPERPPAEIEIDVQLGNGDDVLFVYGRGGAGSKRRSADVITVGSSRRAHLVDLDAAAPGPADTEVFATGVERIFVLGRNGDDRLSGDGIGGRRPFGGEQLSLIGGGGDDRLIGSPSRDLIAGGSGDDRMSGAGGRDSLIGGRGTDRFSGGPANDYLAARDGVRERLNCDGGKRDIVLRDRRDRFGRDCEFDAAETKRAESFGFPAYPRDPVLRELLGR